MTSACIRYNLVHPVCLCRAQAELPESSVLLLCFLLVNLLVWLNVMVS